ncbi:MAG: hypothetical protein ACOY3P_26865 [Planctomycetota bacterium]
MKGRSCAPSLRSAAGAGRTGSVAGASDAVHHGAAHPWIIRWLGGLTLLLLATWLAVAVNLNRQSSGAPSGDDDGQSADDSLLAAAARNADETPDDAEAGDRDTCGRIVRVPVVISPPLELVPVSTPTANEAGVVWRFPETSRSQLLDLLISWGISEEARSEILRLSSEDPASGGLAARPSREYVLGLSPDDRRSLYVGLSRWKENTDQVDAFRFAAGSLEEWIAPDELRTELWQLVQKLTYRNRGMLFFADLRSVEDELVSEEERARLIKYLARDKTFLARLEVDATSDIETLVNYWSRGGRAKDIRPILESLAAVPGGQHIDLIHLLPRFARERIYTYPTPPNGVDAQNRDCHWSALNFFSAEPNDLYCELDQVREAIHRDYYRIYSNYQLGDLVLFLRDTSVIHSAVYVADGFVFTKNGSSSWHPWMLTELDEMRDYYPTHEPLNVQFYRRKDL